MTANTKADFKDHFSGHANRYAEYRPSYPEEMFSWLAGLALCNDTAWDCATGSGQAAESLASYFDRVIATDASEQHINNTVSQQKIRYFCTPAEHSGLASSSVDLITVAQAVHWFDIRKFFSEVERVLRPGGVLAYWSYGLANINQGVDRMVYRLYEEILGTDWWPPERGLVETGYAEIEPPFHEIVTPDFSMTARWSLDQLTGYLRTWSAVNRYMTEKGVDPVTIIEKELSENWGDPVKVRQVVWPLSLTVTRAE